jgi:hypothetical protein
VDGVLWIFGIYLGIGWCTPLEIIKYLWQKLFKWLANLYLDRPCKFYYSCLLLLWCNTFLHKGDFVCLAERRSVIGEMAALEGKY